MRNLSSPFLDRVRDAIRVRHYSIRTEHSYLGWVHRYIVFHGKRPPSEMGAAEVGEFLAHLAVARLVAPSTQNQALNALVFLYDSVLDQPLGEVHNVVRAKAKLRLPVVLTVEEVGRLLMRLRGVHWLIGCLQYGSGLRLLESVRLRVKDLDFQHRAVLVRDGKGGKDRVVTLPDDLVEPLPTKSRPAKHATALQNTKPPWFACLVASAERLIMADKSGFLKSRRQAGEAGFLASRQRDGGNVYTRSTQNDRWRPRNR